MKQTFYWYHWVILVVVVLFFLAALFYGIYNIINYLKIPHHVDLDNFNKSPEELRIFFNNLATGDNLSFSEKLIYKYFYSYIDWSDLAQKDS